MLQISNVVLPFDHPDGALAQAVVKVLGVPRRDILEIKVLRRSLDARKGRKLQRVYTLRVTVADECSLQALIDSDNRVSLWQETRYAPPKVARKRLQHRPLVIGTGPAGLFAGLILAEAGLDPLLIERGKPVQERTRDVNRFWNSAELDTESNVQFGEGGAGTFSDGKLGSRIKDRSGRREKVLQELVLAGAPDLILIDHKPHVGTANLARVVRNLREKIEDLGGEYRFGAKVDDLVIQNGQLQGIVLASGEMIAGDCVILAVGHSARDTFQMLDQRSVQISPKPFSVGFRIEHPQALIDRNQYGAAAGHPALEASDYQLSYHTTMGRTVYSFCMCPGGLVIGAASEQGMVVTNGMSQFERDLENANSAIVAEVFPSDFGNASLGGIAMQRSWEQTAFRLGGGNFQAPVQLIGDFLKGRPSQELGGVVPTYRPGVRLTDLRGIYPEVIVQAISEALPVFENKITGYLQPDAILTGIETRTSCPLRILRGDDLQSVAVRGLYPVGEGSGYAGGIMSSAIDGIKAAESILSSLR